MLGQRNSQGSHNGDRDGTKQKCTPSRICPCIMNSTKIMAKGNSEKEENKIQENKTVDKEDEVKT
jgi:hypothetical protein